ncbi:MAG: hypothetical protein AAGA28_04490 [Pseudomonadota bacterium]
MSDDIERVKALLSRVAADGWNGDGEVRYDDPAHGAGRLVSVVGTTLLGRRVTVAFSDDRRLIFDARDRRILRFVPPAPAGLAPDQADLFQTAYFSGDAAQVVAGMWRDLCRQSTGFRVSTEPLDDAGDPSAPGVSWLSVSQALNLPAPDNAARDRTLERYLAAADGYLTAALIVGQTVSSPVVKGTRDDTKALLDWVEAVAPRLLDPQFPLFGTLETNGVLMFAPDVADTEHVLLAGRLGDYMVATFEAQYQKAVFEIWRDVMGAAH